MSKITSQIWPSQYIKVTVLLEHTTVGSTSGKIYFVQKVTNIKVFGNFVISSDFINSLKYVSKEKLNKYLQIFFVKII